MAGSDEESATRVSERDAIAPQIARRRSGALTVPSGVLVFVCALLPTLRLCNTSANDGIPGFALPPLWPMYALGLAIAITVLRWPRSQTWGWLVLGVIWGVCATTSILIMIEAMNADAPLCDVAIVIGSAGVVAAPTIGRYSEPLVARASAVAAAACALLFGLMAASPDFVWGVQVACVASALLACGCIWWWLESRGAA